MHVSLHPPCRARHGQRTLLFRDEGASVAYAVSLIKSQIIQGAGIAPSKGFKAHDRYIG